MKVLTSRVVVCAIMSFVAGACAYADIPAADYKTLTSKAYVDSLVGDSNVAGNKINGVALSTGGYFYGVEDTTDINTTATRKVSIPNVTELNAGLMIIVKPIVDAEYANNTNANAAKLQLNSFDAKPMRYNGALLTTTTDGYAWKNGFPAIWVYDGTYWNYAGGYDANTTYSIMSVSEGRADSPTTNQRVMTPKKLKAIVHGLKLTSVATDETGQSALTLDITQTGPISTSDTIIDAFGKLQGQITNLSTTVDGLEYLVWDANNTTTQTTATNAYSVTFDSSTNNWPETDSGKIVTGLSLAKGLALKQNILPARSSGNTVNEWAPTTDQVYVAGANQGVPYVRYVTGAGSDGLTQKTGAPAVITYVNGTATSSFASDTGVNANNLKRSIVSLELLKDTYTDLNTKITNNDLSGHKVNGAPLSNTSSYFFGTSTAAKAAEIRQVTINGITELAAGLMIIIKPTITAEYANNDAAAVGKIQLISGNTTFDAKVMRYKGAALTTTTDGYAWAANVPALWVYDGTYWQYVGTYDTNTTYYAMNALTSPSGTSQVRGNGIAGTSTYDNVVSPRILKNVIHNTNLTANAAITGENLGTFNPTNSAITAADTVIGAFGKAQGQINSLNTSVSGLEHDIEDNDASDGHIDHFEVPIPDAIAYTGLRFLKGTGTLFWLPSLAANNNDKAVNLLKEYSLTGHKIVPTMDALAYALDGVVQTRETTEEWQNVARYYRVERADTLYRLKASIGDGRREGDPAAIELNNSGYLQTFAPTLEALMNESYALMQYADSVASSAASNAANNRQIKIPVAGKVRGSANSTSLTTISDWTTANVQGVALVTKTTSDGVVGERRIIDTATATGGGSTTDTTGWTQGKIDVSIPSMATMTTYAQKKKVCAEYAPGTTQSNQSAATCWLWTLAD